MLKIDKEDEKIIKELILPKTVEEISEKTGIDKKKVEDTIKKLEGAKLIKKIDDKYVLIDLVLDMLDQNYRYDISFILEIIGTSENSVKEAIDFLENKLKEDNRFEIISLERMDVIHENETYFAGFEVRLGFYTLSDVIYFIINYSPTTILDVYKPSEIKLSREDLIVLLSDVMVGINQYITLISQLRKENFALKRYIEQNKNKYI